MPCSVIICPKNSISLRRKLDFDNFTLKLAFVSLVKTWSRCVINMFLEGG